MKNVDLVVVGAGFAGLTCAQAAAARGVHTVVLERKPDSGATPHTTGILVKEVADRFDFPRRHTREIAGIRLYSPSLNHLDLESPGYYFLATDTPQILRWLAEQAAARGAFIHFRQPYLGSCSDGGEIILRRNHLRARYLVGCDGARSRVARNHGLARNRKFLFGVEAEMEGVEKVNGDFLHVFMEPRYAPGYIGWVVPGLGSTQIGLAVRRPRVPQLDRFLRKLRGVFDFAKATTVGYRAGLIPCGGPVKPSATKNVMLLGDAAGLVSPLTAGGIQPAMETGQLAGIAISDYLQHGGYDPAFTVGEKIPRYFFKSLLRLLFECAPRNEWLFDRLLGSGGIRELARLVFYHHRGLLSPQAWREIAGIRRQHP